MNQVAQQIITIKIPNGKQCYAEEFRERVAKKMDGVKGSAALFHYDEKGNTLNGTPPCRFISSKNMLGFISERECGLQDVNSIMPYFMQAAIEVFGNAEFGLNIFQRSKSISRSDFPQTYIISGFAKKLKGSCYGLGTASNSKTLDDVIKREINNLIANAYASGIIDEQLSENELDVVIHEASMSVYPVKKGNKLCVANIKTIFSMNYKLNGYWQVGSLTARGKGMIYSYKFEESE